MKEEMASLWKEQIEKVDDIAVKDCITALFEWIMTLMESVDRINENLQKLAEILRDI